MPSDIKLNIALKNWGYDQTHFAVAINREFIPQAQYAYVILNAGDEIEIVFPMQGG